LAEIKQFKDQILTEKNSVKVQEEDKKLAGEVENIRKSFPNLDFDSPDEDGKTLEMKVLQHAVDNNLASFRVAFRDYYHDSLISRREKKEKNLSRRKFKSVPSSEFWGKPQNLPRGLKWPRT
jgi:hypothetical protein